MRTGSPTAYVVEQYLPHPAALDVAGLVSALQAAADGTSVRPACSLLIPDDDLCLHVLLAASPEAAARAAGAAAITPERIVAASAWFAA